MALTRRQSHCHASNLTLTGYEERRRREGEKSNNSIQLGEIAKQCPAPAATVHFGTDVQLKTTTTRHNSGFRPAALPLPRLRVALRVKAKHAVYFLGAPTRLGAT